MMEIKKCECGRPIPDHEEECAICFFGRFEKVKDPMELVGKDLSPKKQTNEEYWQTSMGYYCCVCGVNFLIGWRHKHTYKNYCECCKGKSSFPEEDFNELVY